MSQADTPAAELSRAINFNVDNDNRKYKTSNKLGAQTLMERISTQVYIYPAVAIAFVALLTLHTFNSKASGTLSKLFVIVVLIVFIVFTVYMYRVSHQPAE